ncbi:hypothetical protein FRX31_024767 [Thalictrum thalictroides]|uniref:Transposase-associated domain-containing protein n=1 Tax=Thalictrum thalictroides TaxID=46969 RepID=A0A7J6VNA4_THATH|nr:hypothetical protein FRX31_024767 [Thalictrum thalictroides]
MSTGLDKEWIRNDNIESAEYRKGVCAFIQFLIEKCGGEKYFSCPCKKCLNGTGQYGIDYILTHLLQNGMDKNYTMWYFHREDTVATRKGNEPGPETPIHINENINDNVTQSLDPLVHDVCDEGHAIDVANTSSIPETPKETKYKRLKRLAENPLYPASHEASKHSTMHALVKLNDLKTEFSLSDAATEGVIGLLKELLPEGNTLGKKIHEMKNTLKEADMNYVTYDVYKVTRVDDNGNSRAGATTGVQRRGNHHVRKFARVARTHKRNLEAFLDDEDEENLERHVGKVNESVLNVIQFMQARKWILQQQPAYEDWRRKYDETGRQTPASTWKYAVDDFIIWLKEEGRRTNNLHMLRIAEGPKFNVASYNKFRCNGYTFSTFTYDENKLMQNSGVSMKAYSSDGIMTTYYGVIRGIFDLNYHECSYAVFYCDWVCSEDRSAFKVDTNSKLVMVNLSKVMSSNTVNDEPFILASQASQVFYCKDTKHEGWSIVIPSPKRLTKAIDALEIDQTMYNSVIEENERLCALIDCD